MKDFKLFIDQLMQKSFEFDNKAQIENGNEHSYAEGRRDGYHDAAEMLRKFIFK